MSSSDQESQQKPQMCGFRAPRHVYSCIIKNKTNEELSVIIEYAGINETHSETMDVTLAKDDEQKINEKTFDHENDSGCLGRKTVHKIHVKKFSGKTMELQEPFEGVTSPVQDWEFLIYDNEIKSQNPSEK